MTVHAPVIGRPQPPTSVDAALSRNAFAPYSALGESSNDGLAPNESMFTLAQQCMSAAGYSDVSSGLVPLSIHDGPANLAVSPAWGSWGYLGAGQAQQYGFRVPPGMALTDLGVDLQPTNLTTLPQAEQTAAGKCSTIVQNFANAAQDGPLAGITTLGNDLASEVLRDAAVKRAGRAWAGCMAKNGYRFSNANEVFFSELRIMYPGHGPINITDPVSSSARQAQIATAVSDANCTESADLAGIYFAVQTSYGQQLVNANQQALSADVRRYRAAYARELTRLKALLRNAKAVPFPHGHAKRAG